jgi:ubiquinone/menaquinone biosynthesis C-methylase UbiE
MNKDEFDPFWVTSDGKVVFRGIPVAMPGKEFGLNFRLALLKNVGLGKDILSIGCGIGADLKRLKTVDNKTLGVDPSKEFMTIGKKCKNADDFTQGIGENLPLKDKSFDLILLFEVLEHSINPTDLIKEIYRVLKPGGLLFLTVPNRFFVFETHGAKVCNTTIFLGGIGVPFFSMFPNSIRRKYERARIYDEADVSSLLRENGFDLINTEYLMPPLDVMRNTSLVSSMRKVFFALSKVKVVKMFGANIMVLSVKKIHKHSSDL